MVFGHERGERNRRLQLGFPEQRCTTELDDVSRPGLDALREMVGLPLLESCEIGIAVSFQVE